MSPSSRRIWALAVVFLAGAGVIVLHLALLTLGQHQEWLVRSYQNRWTFRDVPTRRGSLLDRHGQVIATDRSGFELLGNYRQFRRRHAVGAAVHGANLLSEAEDWPDYFGYRGRGGDPLQAFEVLMGIPVKWLGGDHFEGNRGGEIARDLRFYATAVLSSCTGQRRSTVGRLLREALEENRPVMVWEAVVEDWSGLRRSFIQRWDELLGMEQMLGREAGAGELIGILEGWRRKRREVLGRQVADGVERPEWRREDWFQPIADRLSFELAARIRMHRDRHPGLRLFPSVRRVYETLPGRGDSGTLAALMGGVTTLNWVDQADAVEDRVAGALQGFRPWESLGGESDELLETATRSARAAMRRYFESRGRTGTFGAEQALEELLSGTPGLRWAERNRRGREEFLWRSLDVSPGRNVHLTLDVDLQSVLEAVVEGAFDPCARRSHEVALAIIDAERGDILAVGGLPVRVKETADDGTEREFLRRWPPGLGARGNPDVGSVAKPFVLLEHLSARRRGGPFTARFTPCFGKQRYGTAMLGCAKSHGTFFSPVDALAQSCNIYFFQVAEGMGFEGLRRAYERVGWKPVDGRNGGAGPAYQKEIPGIADKSNPDVTRSGQMLQQQAIGYGVNVSPLYVARAYAALATGVLPQLRLVMDGEPAPGVPLRVHGEDLETVREGLGDVVRSGTARGVFPRDLAVHGKTGTAEISRKGHNNAWFAGYLPRTHPEMPVLAFAAVAYFVPDESHGGDVAAKMIARFLEMVDQDEELRRRYLRRREGQQ